MFKTITFLWQLTLLLPTLASLPASVSPRQNVPGDHISSHLIPLLDGTTINPSTTHPLLIFALNSQDPFTSFMATSTSINDFLLQGPTINQSHFLFTAHHQLAEVTNMKALFHQCLSKMSTTMQDIWSSRLHFTNGTASQTLGNELITTLTQWKTPLNKIINADKSINVTRLDCKYTYCPWPSQTAEFTLVAAGKPKTQCGTLPNITDSKSYLFLQQKAPCTPIGLAKAAVQAGAKGVIIATDQSTPHPAPVGHDANSNDQGLNVPVSIVSYTDGVSIAAALSSLSSSSTSSKSLSLSFTTDAALGQFVAIDGTGKLAEIGWEKFDTMQMLGWQAQWFEYQMKRIALTKIPAFVVPVFDAVMTGTTQSITMPPSFLLSQFNTIELDFSLECPAGNMEEECSVWDRIVSVTAQCDNDIASFEVGRWINAFQRQGHWLTKTSILSSDLGNKNCNFTFNVGLNNPWRASLNIRYSNVLKDRSFDTSMVPIVYLNPSESFTSNAYNINKTFSFTTSKTTSRIELVSLITGHSGCEFVSTSHTFVINQGKTKNNYSTSDPSYYDRYMNAGTNYGCANQIVNGATPNEHGTWYFGRNGWCNGQDVKPLIWDITSDINIGGSNELKYQALAYPINGGNGTDAGCAGNIRQSSYLIFHSGTEGTENGNGKRTATKHVRAMLIEEE